MDDRPMRDTALYAELRQRMTEGSDKELVADLSRFLDSFGDHDPDCPGFAVSGREAELATCRCGFARRYDFLDELRTRLGRRIP